MDIVGIVVSVLVTAASLFLISKLPTGVEIDNLNKTLIAAAVFGLLNAFVRPILSAFISPAGLILSGSLVQLLLNMLIFGLAAWLVEGFRLRWGIWSALIGAIALVIINQVLYQVLGAVL
ncbi:MAG TPA: phage holin family protein [Oscillatoriaceae cyanobacterium M33_DOE_052]|uniref:Phage holin family protein n=1 Tax=Planktothricoides sp. SpSt-374 TaxID=2282167 RepID=A0A7C3ZJV9_9CYAN|nr:phage holin family protein [Oscillatoriaceae cyanobacterium M33_DOE_052]